MQKRRGKADDGEQLEDLRLCPIPTRDHWDRLQTFTQRQFPKRRPDHFVPLDVMRQAEAASRDSPLGILDTISREFITYWMPEVELFLADDAYDNDDIERKAYMRMADALSDNVVSVVDRINAKGDKTAEILAAAVRDCARKYLVDLYEACMDVLNEQERQTYNLKHIRQEQEQFMGSLTEARVLDSSMVWSFSDLQRPASPRKPRRPQTQFLDEPDPTDNGQIWNSPSAEFKKRHFDVEITNTIKISSIEGLVDDTQDDTQIRPATKRPLVGEFPEVIDGRERFRKSMQYTQESIARSTSIEDEGEFSIPGSFV